MNHPEHEAKIIEFVTQYQAANGHAPTYREIAEAVGVYSLDHVSRDLKRVVASGALILKYPDRQPGTNPPRGTRGPSAYSLRYKCSRCHIRISTITGECEDCATRAPLITYADAMGAERFYQMQRPAPVGMGYEKETRKRTRRAYNRKG